MFSSDVGPRDENSCAHHACVFSGRMLDVCFFGTALCTVVEVFLPMLSRRRDAREAV